MKSRHDSRNWLFNHFDVDDWEDFVFDIIVPYALIFGMVSGMLALVVFLSRKEDDVMKCDDIVKSIEAHGETHEYILYGRGITHLPNCEFCKGVINHD